MSQWGITAVALGSVLFITGAIWLYMRRQYILFTEAVCSSIDKILEGDAENTFQTESDELLSKIQMQLVRLQEITAFHAQESERQKQKVQGIVSDISHQLKTPIANVVMYCDTAVNPKLSERERDMCLGVLKNQVGKLDILVQACGTSYAAFGGCERKHWGKREKEENKGGDKLSRGYGTVL